MLFIFKMIQAAILDVGATSLEKRHDLTWDTMDIVCKRFKKLDQINRQQISVMR